MSRRPHCRTLDEMRALRARPHVSAPTVLETNGACAPSLQPCCRFLPYFCEHHRLVRDWCDLCRRRMLFPEASPELCVVTPMPHPSMVQARSCGGVPYAQTTYNGPCPLASNVCYPPVYATGVAHPYCPMPPTPSTSCPPCDPPPVTSDSIQGAVSSSS